MAYLQRRGRYDYSPSPPPRYRSRSRSPMRRYDENAHNPGNNLYVTGLSTRVSERELEDHFSTEGKVMECHLVVDPRSKESRGFGFVTMNSMESAERCIKYLNRSILEGRVITVERNSSTSCLRVALAFACNMSHLAKRKRARTPTPGKYLGIRATTKSSSYDYERRERRRSPRYSPYYGSRYSPYRNSRDYSPQYSPYHGRGSSKYRERSRSRSPYATPRSSYHLNRSRSRSRSRSPSPYGNTRRSSFKAYRSRSRSLSRSLSTSRSRSPSPYRYR